MDFVLGHQLQGDVGDLLLSFSLAVRMCLWAGSPQSLAADGRLESARLPSEFIRFSHRRVPRQRHILENAYSPTYQEVSPAASI